MKKHCSFPGCTRSAIAHGRCNPHVPRREVPGYRDLYCQICEYGPLVTLVQHTIVFHDGPRDYKHQFGQDSLYSQDYLFNRRSIWLDMIEDGKVVLPRPQSVCAKGHRVTRATGIPRRHPDGRITYRCRKCSRQRFNEWQRKKRAALKVKRPKRRCDQCRQWYRPTQDKQRFCQKTCKAKWHNAKWYAEHVGFDAATPAILADFSAGRI